MTEPRVDGRVPLGVRVLFWMASLTGLWLLFNLVAMPLAWGGSKSPDGLRGAVQLVILMGFLLVFVFDLISLGWLVLEGRSSGSRSGLNWVQLLGLVGLVGMFGAKVLVDEIARETPLGRAGGEWGLLYGLLNLQLFYVLVILFRTQSRTS